MKTTRLVGFALLPVAFGMLLAAPVQAKDKYQSTIVEEFNNSTDFSFTKSGSKVKFQPSTKDGDGGVVTQLNVKFIDCPSVANDKGKAGKCGEKGVPICDHVMVMNVRALGVEVPNAAGLRYCIEKGKVYFPDTGKNKIPGSALGALVTLLFDKPLGIGVIKLQTPGSNPSDCDTAPPPSTCTDGDVYGIAGIVVGNDPSLVCTTDADCSTTAVCGGGGLCTPETCTVDADCDEGGGVGTGECGSGGTCCDPGTDPTCPDQVP